MGNIIGRFFVPVESFGYFNEDGTPHPFNGYGMVQLLFHAAVYAYILFWASNLISDGSELLLLIPSIAGLVGSVVLPVLGAVPDGAIVLFSGLGDKAKAQKNLDVGVGALAGSTIMLLTIPWALAVFAGRVNLDKRTGVAQYKKPIGAADDWSKLSPPGSMALTGTGINVRPIVRSNAVIMLVTAIGYLIIQGAAFGDHCGKKDDLGKEGVCSNGSAEKNWALGGLVYCVLALLGYLYFQVRNSNSEAAQELIDEARKKAISSKLVSLTNSFAFELMEMAKSDSAHDGSVPLHEDDKRLKSMLRPYFAKYDRNHDGTIDENELRFLLSDLHEDYSDAEMVIVMKQMDTDNSGSIDFDEFCAGMRTMIERKAANPNEYVNRTVTTGVGGQTTTRNDRELENGLAQSDAVGVNPGDGGDDEDDDESDDGEEDVPAEFKDMSPQQQQRAILKRSLWMMTLGTIVVLVVSDPMVDVLSEIGHRTDIPPFYVSFVLAPLASNASELIASYSYALKKTKKTATIAISALEGAAALNNTFCLGIFLGLVYARGLVWQYSAETASILLVELAMFVIAIRKSQSLAAALAALSLFPLSIIVVIVLEKAGWD